MTRPCFVGYCRRLRRWGAVSVEAALAIPILIGVGLIGTDINRIHTERIRLESTAGAMAVNVAAQPVLTVSGVDALAQVAMQGHESMQQITVLSVLQSGRVAWALPFGRTLCQPQVEAGMYTGDLPEDPPEKDPDSDEDRSTASMVVVQSCRSTEDVALSGGLVLPDVLETVAVFRASNQSITLDKELQARSDATGLAYVSP